jgi:hypothetical protein
MTYCMNCLHDHAVEATEEHQAPCQMCGSDGHARCQHVSFTDGEFALVPDEQGRFCSRCHQDHTPQDCYYRV